MFRTGSHVGAETARRRSGTAIVVAVALGVFLVDKWAAVVLGRSQRVGDWDTVVGMTLAQAALCLAAIGLLRWRGPLARRTAAAAVALLAATGLYIGWRALGETRAAREERETARAAAAEALTRELLRTVIDLDSRRSAQLDLETREILYESGRTSWSIPVRVPADGVLDVADGVEPLRSSSSRTTERI